MRSIVRTYKKNPDIRFLAGQLTQGLPNKAWFAEIRACFNFVRENIRYTEDITAVETIQTPDRTLQFGYGDCDDMGVLLCSLLESIGKPTQFKAIGFAPDEYEHVFSQALAGQRWISLDPTEPYPMGWEPPDYVSWMVCTN